MSMLNLFLQITRYLFHKLIINNLLFYPKHDILWIPKYEFFKSNIINKIIIWEFFSQPKNDIIIIFQGNSENMTYYKDIVDYSLTMGYNVVIFDYHGFGFSSGTPSQQTILDNGLQITSHIHQKYPNNNLILWGDSLGCSIASHVAKNMGKNIKSVIIMNGFSSICDVICDDYSKLKHIIALLFKIFDCDLFVGKWLKDIDNETHVIFLHSMSDIDIPIINFHRNYNMIKSEKHVKFIEIYGSHYEPILTQLCLDKIKIELKQNQ